MTLSAEETKAVASAAAEVAATKAIANTFLLLGCDVSKPEQLLELQADLMWIRKSRKGSDELNKLMKKSAIGVAIPAILFAVWQGFRLWLEFQMRSGGGHP